MREFETCQESFRFPQTTMTVVNTETVPGRTITQMLGLVQGNTVRAKHVGRDLMAGLKNIVIHGLYNLSATFLIHGPWEE